MRQPTLVERLVFSITCIGFCNVRGNKVRPEEKSPTTPLASEQLEHCARYCGAKLPNAALRGGPSIPRLPEKT